MSDALQKVSVPSYFRENSVDDLYYILRQTHRGQPLTWETRKPIFYGPHGGSEIECLVKNITPDDAEGAVCYNHTENGVAEGSIVDRDGWFGSKSTGDYYEAGVVLNYHRYTVRASRYDNLFADDFFISILDDKGQEIARVDEDWNLAVGSDLDFVNAALGTFCNPTQHDFEGYMSPVEARSYSTFSYIMCNL